MTAVHVSCLLFFTCVVTTNAKLQESDILLLNQPLNVFFGRTTTLDPLNNLQINVRSGDSCVLTVVGNNEELGYIPGRLSKSEFPCNFGPEEVKYIHYGGHTGYTEHSIQLLLRYDSSTETVIIPFNLIIKIHNRTSEIISDKQALAVDRHLGLSTLIDPSVLKFFYNRNVNRCVLSIISPSSGLPQYGNVVNNTNPLTNVDCDTFLTYGVQYKHNTGPKSANIDFIPMHVQLFRNDGEIISEEYFQLEVKITTGNVNTPPRASENAYFIMDSINQFVMTAITPDVVSGTDDETPSDRLLFKITQPLGPGEGHIVNTDNRNLPIYSFYQHDINNLKVAYKPPSTDSSIQRIVQLAVTIFDPDGLSSSPIHLMILVMPMNTFAPVVTTNAGIQLVEGQSRPIESPNILEISDEDNLENVRITQIDGLRNGYLTIPAGKNYFTAEDLRTGQVVYHHDDSETFSDNIIFKMSDGTYEVEFLFPVTIYPKDDNSPILIFNTGLEIKRHGLSAISTFVLSAFDIDTDDYFITYTLEAPLSTSGLIVKRQFEIPFDVQDWEFDNGYYEKAVVSFTQKDLDEGKIFYKYIVPHSSAITTERIKFSLQDNGNPPNKSPIQEFVVRVHPFDEVPPFLFTNTVLELEVEETNIVPFRRRNLRYSDDQTNDRAIMYIIRQQPVDTYNRNSTAGLVIKCDQPDRPVYRFSQAEVYHQKVCYQPPEEEQGITTSLVQFWFEVEDLAGNKLENQRFKIIIKPVNNQPPFIHNTGAVVSENGQVILDTQYLDIKDRDTDLRHLIIYVRRTPAYGILQKDGKTLTVGSAFHHDDIAHGKIVYKNNGQNVERSADSFVIEVTDGVHYIPSTFRIVLEPVDDEPTYMKNNAQLGKMTLNLKLFEQGEVILKAEDFRLIDLDTDVQDITYLVLKLPDFGQILRNGSPASFFTQKDIDSRQVLYKHSGNEVGTETLTDTIQLTFDNALRVLLPDGSRLRDIDVKFKILPVDNQTPVVSVVQDVNVNEGGNAPVLPSHVRIEDADSAEESILCLIYEQPKNGFIENKSPAPGSEIPRLGIAISSFTFADIIKGHIFYVQNIHVGLEHRHDWFTFQCSDGINIAEKTRLTIRIHGTNDEPPDVFVRELMVAEGGVIDITKSVLFATDADSPRDILTFIITHQPKHGKIKKRTSFGVVAVNNFTVDDIKENGTIVYEHDGSESRKDSFEVELTDGVHSIRKSVPVDIFPVDDEPPRLTINNGLVIDKLGESKFITSNELKAEDTDSAMENITYIIRRTPQFGVLRKKFEKNFKNLTYDSNFTQLDINKNLIQYVHTGKEAVRDVIKFDITDGLNPSVDRDFYVTIKGIDMIYPEVVSHGITLPEGGTAVLTSDILSATDKDLPDELLKFLVTREPEHGFLEFADHPGKPVNTFSQLDIAASRVQYVHYSEDEVKMDSFQFEVSDGHNQVSRTFRIAVLSVDNKMPVVMSTKLQLKEGENKIITRSELKAIDMDTEDDKIIFTITQVPLHGNLLYNYSRIVTRFSQKDINSGLISYQQDGTKTASDNFIYTVTDGTHLQFFVSESNIPVRRPQAMDIDIIPLDNNIPHVTVNKAATALTHVEGGIGFRFNNGHLQSEDKDSQVERLLYVLSVPPKHGFLRNLEKGKGAVVAWTQGNQLTCQLTLSVRLSDHLWTCIETRLHETTSLNTT